MAPTIIKALVLLLPFLLVSESAKLPFFEDLDKPFNSILPFRGDNHDGVTPSHSNDVKTANPVLETNFPGAWKLDSENAGVSAMQLQLMPNDKVVWFDTTDLGPSAIQFPAGHCRVVDAKKNITDCWAHGVEYDPKTATVRLLQFLSDPWCSSGGLGPNGELINTGGNNGGKRSIRIMYPCNNTCDIKENPTALAGDRWYATQQKLQDGSFVVVGGRGAYSYDIIPPNSLHFPPKKIDLPFLKEAEDAHEDNLYPFVFLLPSGNLFIFANNRGIIIHRQTGKTLREFPVLPGGSRNYPGSGMAALLPLTLDPENPHKVKAEVLVCGGNTMEAYIASKDEPRKFLPALQDCGRICVNKKDAQWEIEMMPTRRTMGDMLILPTGDLLIIGGAQAGTAAWYQADNPNFTPVIYSPNKKNGERMKELAPGTIPRMYHSASALLRDGQILLAGSNPNQYYDFKAKYPTEVRVEKFVPPYLDPKLDQYRPEIIEVITFKRFTYGQKFKVYIKLNALNLDESDIKVTMLEPPFTTHGFSQNQRMLVLGLKKVTNSRITVVAPASGKLAPPGYYMLFVVYRGVPSRGMWVQIL